MARRVRIIRDMYLTAMPVLLGGVSNMIFTKTPLYKNHRAPMDGGRTLPDGKRVFGDNKTWIGFGSMVALTALSQAAWGGFVARRGLNAAHDIYRLRRNTPVFNLAYGSLSGFAYAACELPNSFLKRRLDIRPGKTERGLVGKTFFVVDQIDSLLGVFLAQKAFSDISWARYVQYIIMGAGTHVGVNWVMYRLGIRKNW